MSVQQAAVVGAGSWGTALAKMLINEPLRRTLAPTQRLFLIIKSSVKAKSIFVMEGEFFALLISTLSISFPVESP